MVIKRLWHPLKSESVRLRNLVEGLEVHQVSSVWVSLNTDCRPHSSLDSGTPRMAYERTARSLARAAQKRY